MVIHKSAKLAKVSTLKIIKAKPQVDFSYACQLVQLKSPLVTYLNKIPIELSLKSAQIPTVYITSRVHHNHSLL